MASSTLVAFFTLQIIALVTLPILTVTFLLPRANVRRHCTITNFIFIAILFAIFSCLLLFTRRLTGPEPPRALCEAQAALMFGGPPALAVAALSLVVKVWHMAWSLDKRRTLTMKYEKGTNIILIIAPYFTWIAIAGVSAGLGHAEVYRYSLYCTSARRSLGIFSGVSSAVVLFITSCIQGWAVVIVYRRYKASSRSGPQDMGEIDCALFTRICVFSIFVVGTLVLSLLAAAMSWSMEICDVLAATVYPAIFCVFASQADVLEAWGIRSCRPRTMDAENQSQGCTSEGDSATRRTTPGPHRCKFRFLKKKPVVAEPISKVNASRSIEVLHTLNRLDEYDSKPISTFQAANASISRIEEESTKSGGLDICRSPLSWGSSHRSIPHKSVSGCSDTSAISSQDHSRQEAHPTFSVARLPPEPDKSKPIKDSDGGDDDEAIEFSPSHEWESQYSPSFDHPAHTRPTFSDLHNSNNWRRPS